MPSQNNDLVIHIISDASDVVAGIEQAFKRIEKLANKAEPFTGVMADINDLKNSITSLQKDFQKLAVGKVDTTQLDSVKQKFEQTVKSFEQMFNKNPKFKANLDNGSFNELNVFIERLKKNYESLLTEMSLSGNKNLGKTLFDNYKNDISNLNTQINTLSATITNLEQKISAVSSNSADTNKLSTEALEIKNILSQISGELERISALFREVYNLPTADEISKQWGNVVKAIDNCYNNTGKFKKGITSSSDAFRELCKEYQRYLNMGGTNQLSGVEKAKDNVDVIIDGVKKLNEEMQNVRASQIANGASIIKIDTADLTNIKEAESALRALKGIITQKTAPTNGDDLVQYFTQIANALQQFSGLNSNVVTVLSSLKTSTNGDSFRDIASGLDQLKISLVAFENDTKAVFNSIDALLAKRDELSNLATIFKAISEQLANVSTVNQAELAFAKVQKTFASLTTQSSALQAEIAELGTAVGNLRIAKNDGDMANAYAGYEEKLSDVLTKLELQKQEERDIQGQVNKHANAIKKLTNAQNEYLKLKMKDITSNSNVDMANQLLEALTKAQDCVSSASKAQKELNKLLDAGKITAEQYAEALGSYGSYGDSKTRAQYQDAIATQMKSITSAIDKAKVKMNELQNLSSNDAFANLFKEAQTEVERLDNELKSHKISISEYNKQITEIQRNLKANKNTVAFVDKGNISQAVTKMYELAGSIKDVDVKSSTLSLDNKNLTMVYKDQAGVLQTVIFKYDQLTGAITRANVQSQKQMTGFQSFLAGINQRLTAFAQYTLSFLSIFTFINQIKTGIGYVKEMDTALTEMLKVSDENRESLIAFQKESFNLAKSIGASVSELNNSTADFMRIGESLEEAKESAMSASILKNVSEYETISEATDALIAMSQAYKDLDKITIIDKLNEVGNNFAISTDELAEGLKRSGSTLALLGNTIDESIALVTSANAVIQDVDSVSAGIRTIGLRLIGTDDAKAQLESMNEELDDYVQMTTSKKREVIMNYTRTASNTNGVDILNEKGNYKNPYEIINEIRKVYKEIVAEDEQYGTNRAKALIEEMAGKNRSNILSAILQSDDLEAIKKASEEAFGSAEKENAKYMESIEGKWENFKTTVQEFWNTLISSDAIKTAIDLLTELMEKLTDFIKEHGSGKFLLGIASALGGLKWVTTKKGLDTLSNGFKGLKKIISGVSSGAITLGTTFASLSSKVGILIKGIGAFLAGLTSLLPVIAGVGVAIGAIVAINYFSPDAYLERGEKAFEKYQEKLEEITTIQNEIEQNSKRINELELKINPSLVDEAEIEKLKAENEQLAIKLQLQQDLAEQNKQEASDNTVKGLTTGFDSKLSLAQLAVSNAKKAKEEIEMLEKQEDLTGIAGWFQDVQLNNAKSNYKRQESLAEEYVKEFEKAIDTLDLSDEDAKNLYDALNKIFDDYHIAITPTVDLKVEEAEKAQNTISASMESLKTESENVYNSLINLAQGGDLSTDILSKRIPNIVKELDDAGVSAEELLQYLNSIANQDKIDYSAVRKELYTEKGVLQARDYDEEHLNAYLEIKSVYSEDITKAWSAVDWAREIQAIVDQNRIDAKVVVDTASVSEMIDSITSLSDAFDSLDAIYADNKDGDVFDFERLDSKKFEETFGTLGIEYEDFITAIANSPNDIDPVQASYDALTQCLLEHSGILKTVNEDNAGLCASYLELYGIENADALVKQALADNTLNAMLAEKDLIDANYNLIETENELDKATKELVNSGDENIAKFIEESIASGQLTEALAVAMMKKLMLNDTYLETQTDVDNLLKLAEVAGIATNTIINLQNAKRNLMIAEKQGDQSKIDKYTKEIEDLQADLDKEIANVTAKYKGGNSSNKTRSSSSKDTWLEEYKNQLSILNDQLDAELVTEKEFYIQSEALLNKYLKDTPAHMKKYSEEIAEAEKNLYNAWNNAFDSYSDNLEQKYNDGLLTTDEYYQKLSALAYEYYGIDMARMDAVKLKMAEMEQLGNVDLFNRPIVNSDAMKNAGYDVEDGSSSTVYTGTNFAQDANGNFVAVHYTPILPDGTVLSQDTINTYISDILSGSQDMLQTDANALGIVLNVEDVNIPQNEMIQYLQTGITTPAVDEFLAKSDEWDKELHTLQQDYYHLGQAVNQYGNSTKKITEVERLLASIRKSSMTSALSGVQMIIDKTISKYQKLQSTAQKAYDKQTRALNKQKEALEDSVYDLNLQVESIEDSIYNIDKQIESLDKVVEVRQKEIDKIREANDETNRALTLEKAKYDLEKAQNQKTVATYKGGQIVYDVDHSAVKNAQESVKQAEEDIRVANIEKEIKLLEERQEMYESQKEILENQKESLERQIELIERQERAIDRQVTAIERMANSSNEYYNDILDKLDLYNDKWSRLANVESTAQQLANMQSLLDRMGVSTTDIINMSDDAFQTFSNNYLGCLAVMYAENEETKRSIAQAFNLEGLQGFDEVLNMSIEDMKNMNQSDLTGAQAEIDNTTSALGETERQARATSNAIAGSGKKSNSVSSSVSQMADNADGRIPQVSQKFSFLTDSVRISSASVLNLSNLINGLSDKTVTITTNYVDNHISQTSTNFLKKFATGVKKNDKDQEAWTQDKGREIIVSPSRNAILTPLKAGDSVLNNAMTENMWKWAKSSPAQAMGEMQSKIINSIPNLSNVLHNSEQSQNLTFNISMPNINDSSSAQNLIDELQSTLSSRKIQFFNKKS